MGVLSIILLVLFIIVALLLVFMVAIQDEKSTGLGGIFGGSSESAFGSSSSTFLTKATTILAVAFMVLALLVALCNRGSSDNVVAFAEQQSQTAAGTTWLESDSVNTDSAAATAATDAVETTGTAEESAN